MKTKFFVFSLAVLGVSACAHNPRPESPEQRAERQAQYLQEQQNARAYPESVGYTTRVDDEQSTSRAQDASATESRTRSNRAADTQARERAAAVRGTVRPIRVPVYTGVTGAVGGILR